jgi:hypothetical protein
MRGGATQAMWEHCRGAPTKQRLCAAGTLRAHGCCGPISSLLVVDDVPASPPPRALISARKPHARGIPFYSDRLLMFMLPQPNRIVRSGTTEYFCMKPTIMQMTDSWCPVTVDVIAALSLFRRGLILKHSCGCGLQPALPGGSRDPHEERSRFLRRAFSSEYPFRSLLIQLSQDTGDQKRQRHSISCCGSIKDANISARGVLSRQKAHL